MSDSASIQLMLIKQIKSKPLLRMLCSVFLLDSYLSLLSRTSTQSCRAGMRTLWPVDGSGLVLLSSARADFLTLGSFYVPWELAKWFSSACSLPSLSLSLNTICFLNRSQQRSEVNECAHSYTCSLSHAEHQIHSKGK